MATAVKCIQSNLQHAKAASNVFGRRFRKEGVHLAFIQETWVNSGRVCGLGDAEGRLITAPRVTRPRACILVKKSVHSFNLYRFCCQDVVAVHVQIPAGRIGGGMEFVACSAYFPGDKTADLPPPKKVRELISFCKRKNLQLVIGCDANGHNEAWGSTDTNFRGEIILNYLIGEGLVVNNIGSEPTFVTCNRKEVLDITVSSSDRISKWRVSSEPSCSDHRHIQFEISVGERTLLQYRDPKCTDWEGYNRSLVHLLEPTIAKVRDRDEIEIAAEQLRCAIITAYSENCPLKTKKDNRKSSWWNNKLDKTKKDNRKSSWWNNKLDKRRKEVRHIFNRAKASGNWETYRTTLAEYNKEIRRAKRVLEKVLWESGRSTPKHQNSQDSLKRTTE
ncbi:uncharacterized protein LOC115887629 [Sitophilus oryzae]|uniref:Uncharacterized protein LOC115887629 n=1 Tax=Sitophilus oryzae TaxID=7048 RepID=A0A6J2YJA9_SITOR|nr:uncharacterized protein LOC115887629 [Sitophilus oryzae]